MPKVPTMKLIREQQKRQEGYMTLAFIRFTEEKKREIPDGIIASMMKIADGSGFKDEAQAYDDLLTLFELYDNTKKNLHLNDAES